MKPTKIDGFQHVLHVSLECHLCVCVCHVNRVTTNAPWHKLSAGYQVKKAQHRCFLAVRQVITPFLILIDTRR